MRIGWFLIIIASLLQPALAGSKTYIADQAITVYLDMDFTRSEQWPERTLFTAKMREDDWLQVTGIFPEGLWQPVDETLLISIAQPLTERVPYQDNGAPTVLYQAFEHNGSKAKAYKLIESAKVWDQAPIETDDNEWQGQGSATEWPKDTVFTARYEHAHYLKITGHFPDGNWQALPEPVWLLKPVKLQDRTQPRPFIRTEGAKRFALINKDNFDLTLYEVTSEGSKKLMRTPVALGYDRCLSEEQGGKCYYTPEGEFEIDFTLFDPDGIKWCVPPKMEQEFAERIASGERCWRGIMGQHALHFGDSLFLHGTSNPNSIGSRTTHGCVRLRNPDIELVYRLLRSGDKVVVTSEPEQYDWVVNATN